MTNMVEPAALNGSEKSSRPGQNAHPILQVFVRRLVTSLLILLVIAFLSLFSLYVAKNGQAGLPTDIFSAMWEALRQTFDYLVHHPLTYYWHKANTPWLEVVSGLFLNSAGLLLVSLLLATVLGMGLGIIAAVLRHRRSVTPLMILASILGISTPSFLLAMLLHVFNISLFPLLGLKKALLPPTGMGWDLHLIMPALVLAVRPLAQIMQVTYISLADVLDEEYIRAARARGASRQLVLWGHAVKNILIPVLTTLGTSLRYSLASLPVVESFYVWPGIGSTILQAVTMDMPTLLTDLILSLGLLFLLINLTLDVLYPLIDPRLRRNGEQMDEADEMEWGESWGSLGERLSGWKQAALQLFHRREKAAAPAPYRPPVPPPPAHDSDAAFAVTRGHILKSALTNVPFMVGTLLVIGLILLALFGSNLSPANPFETHTLAKVNGQLSSPPFKPSAEFPWGSDPVGRDIQALVLAGTQQTLSMALFATLARLLLGVALGMIAGWWQNSWVDKLLKATLAVWSAFPVTIFAMLIILALGIQKGMSVFVIALCLVGWGEIAQFVRTQVIRQKPQLYVEAARSVGARPREILLRHILPHMLPSIIVMGVLEMGGVLLLLAELGFLNIFLGGGFRVEVGQSAGMKSISYFFSDVPEWGALLANIRSWWRSYPWTAWYPGVFFFISILTFNVWGEGLRRFLEESRINLARFINRYSLMGGVAALVVAVILLQSAAPILVYKPSAQAFDAERAMQHIRFLASPDMLGREAGTAGGKQAADYIAQQMEEIGLLPGGNDNTFVQTYSQIYFHMPYLPMLEMEDGQGRLAQEFTYRQDFLEYALGPAGMGNLRLPVVGVAVGLRPNNSDLPLPILKGDQVADRAVIVRESDLARVNVSQVGALLVIGETPDFLEKRYLNVYTNAFAQDWAFPRLYITPQTADLLLQSAGSSSADLAARDARLGDGQLEYTQPGATARLRVGGLDNEDEKQYNVIGYIPGTGAATGAGQIHNLDSQVIILSAYYDGLGTGPDGTLYPGANDNASGVAEMLEIARAMKNSPYQPKKTIVFVAWSGGDRREGLSIKNVMNAKAGFGLLNVEAVVELSGVGAGSGKAVQLESGSSFRLATLFKDAARRVGLRTTNLGRGVHADIENAAGFGGRRALSIYLSWDGSDTLAHTPRDTIETIDIDKLRKSGQATALMMEVLARETVY